MIIPVKTPILLYNYQYKKYGPKAQIILVSKDYYWFGNSIVGYWDNSGNIVYWNIRYIEHITHIVPYNMKNLNYGQWIKGYNGFGRKLDADFFINNMQWQDFEKENIKSYGSKDSNTRQL